MVLGTFRLSYVNHIIIFTEGYFLMDKNYRLGIFYGLGAYLLWGVLPIYWKLLQHVEAMEILASRFLWSAVFVFLLLLATGKLNIFMQETKAIFSTKRLPAAWCWQQL